MRSLAKVLLGLLLLGSFIPLVGCNCGACVPWGGLWSPDDAGCPDKGHRLKKRPTITARPASPANQGEPCGIPFYLPKPLLVISKNVCHVETPTVGLTDTAPIPTGFDNQETYGKADLNSNVAYSAAKPGEAPAADKAADGARESKPYLHSEGAPVSPNSANLRSDGLAPHMFFTYEIVFVPDLTQKYVLDVEGGAGEVRAAINMVNGWQFTGLGPYYMKDSSTAQNLFARGVQINLGLRGAADLVNSIANLQGKAAANGAKISQRDFDRMRDAMERAAAQEAVDWQFLTPEHWADEYVTDKSGNVMKTGRKVPPAIERYAEIYVYEAVLVEGQMVWKPVANHTFAREFLGTAKTTNNAGAAKAIGELMKGLNESRAAAPSEELSVRRLPSLETDSKLVREVVEKTLTPPSAPPRRGCLDFLHHRPAATVNRTVVGPLPVTEQ